MQLGTFFSIGKKDLYQNIYHGKTQSYAKAYKTLPLGGLIALYLLAVLSQGSFLPATGSTLIDPYVRGRQSYSVSVPRREEGHKSVLSASDGPSLDALFSTTESSDASTKVEQQSF